METNATRLHVFTFNCHVALILVLRLCGGAVVLWTLLVSLLGQHAYVERHVPNVDVAFWQER